MLPWLNVYIHPYRTAILDVLLRNVLFFIEKDSKKVAELLCVYYNIFPPPTQVIFNFC